MDDDGEKWSREGKKDEKETIYYNPEILAEAETIFEGKMASTVWEKTEKNPTYDTHLKFIGKKLLDINNNLNQTNKNLWWLSIVIQMSISLIIIIIGYGLAEMQFADYLFRYPGIIFAIIGLGIFLVVIYKILGKFSELIL